MNITGLTGVIRVLTAVIMFIVFAFSHYMATSTKEVPIVLAKARQDLPAGARIRPDDLVKETIYGDESLFRSFVAYDDRGKDLLFNPLNRKIVAGELISIRDLLQPTTREPLLRENEVGVHISLDRLAYAERQLTVGIHVGFLVQDGSGNPELLKPFRIVAIGSNVQKTTTEETEDRRILTIAAKLQDGKLDEQSSRLIAATTGDQDEKLAALVMLGTNVEQ